MGCFPVCWKALGFYGWLVNLTGHFILSFVHASFTTHRTICKKWIGIDTCEHCLITFFFKSFWFVVLALYAFLMGDICTTISSKVCVGCFLFVSRIILLSLKNFAVLWFLCRISRRWIDICFQPWCNLFRLTGLKAPTFYFELILFINWTAEVSLCIHQPLFVQTQIEELKIQLDQLESELELMECTSKKKKMDKDSVSCAFIWPPYTVQHSSIVQIKRFVKVPAGIVFIPDGDFIFIREREVLNHHWKKKKRWKIQVLVKWTGYHTPDLNCEESMMICQ